MFDLLSFSGHSYRSKTNVSQKRKYGTKPEKFPQRQRLFRKAEKAELVKNWDEAMTQAKVE